MNIHIIWAQDNNGGIGKNNSLPWHISEDLQNFKKITLNHPIVMGRKTWESLPKKPLPNRRNIVLSSIAMPNIESYTSIESCIDSLDMDNVEDVFIIGGKMIYDSFFSYADILHITFIDKQIDGIDTYFPVNIDQIKKTYQVDVELPLAEHCIYTKWIKKN